MLDDDIDGFARSKDTIIFKYHPVLNLVQNKRLQHCYLYFVRLEYGKDSKGIIIQLKVTEERFYNDLNSFCILSEA